MDIVRDITSIPARVTSLRQSLRKRRKVIPRDAKVAHIITEHGRDLLNCDGMRASNHFMQHGSTSVFTHSVAVTALALTLARDWQVSVDVRSLTRASLLHDYFLYDWHKPHPDNKIHGFTHPFTACRNAIRDHHISRFEQHMIMVHMFPMVPLPPLCREAALLCLADKIVATRETIKRH